MGKNIERLLNAFTFTGDNIYNEGEEKLSIIVMQGENATTLPLQLESSVGTIREGVFGHGWGRNS